MELFKEYTDLVDLYDRDPTHPQTQNELINICYLPEFYSRFGLNTDKQKLALSSKHLYTMQVAKENGYYSESHTTHYHNLKKDTMLKIPELIAKPDFVLYDQSSFDLQENKIPSSLVCILPQKNIVINKKTKESRKEVLVAYIDEPINPNDNVTILATSFRRPEIEKYIERLAKKDRVLYINEDFLNGKKSLSTVYPGMQFTNIATHSNGETRNSMAFLGSLDSNIRQYRENVNLKRMDVSGLYLEHIPENERTKIVCNRAFANNPYAVNPEKEPDEKEIVKTFETWSEGNLYERLKASPIPQNIQSISNSVLSFENNKSGILDIIGKQFETDSSGKPTLNGMKQLSKAMEIYSDKHYETARYLFIKDGVITRHIAVSSQTPASTIIKPDDKFLYELKNYAKETGSKIVFLHNHPSGYVEPSEADINLTDYLTNFFEESDGSNIFSGHIILDHGTYGLYDSNDRKWNALIAGKIKPLSDIEKSYKLQLTEHKKKADFNKDYSITNSSLKELSEYAKSCDDGEVWNRKDWVPSFLLTGSGVVTSLEYINTLELQNEDSLSEKLKFLGRKYGSENIVMLPSDITQFLLCESYAQKSGKIKDVFLEKKDGTFEVSAYRNGNIFNDLRKDEIIIEDTERNIGQEKEEIFYGKSVNKITNKEKEYKTVKDENQIITASTLIKELEAYAAGSKEIYGGLINYVYHRSAAQEAGRKSIDNFQTLFINLVANNVSSEIARNGLIEKIKLFDDMTVIFDPDNININSVGLIDRNGEINLKKELVHLKESYGVLVNNLRHQNKLQLEEEIQVQKDIDSSDISENPQLDDFETAMEISEIEKTSKDEKKADKSETNVNYQEPQDDTSLSTILDELKRKDVIIEKLMKQNQTLLEQNQAFAQKLAVLEEKVLAPREVQEKKANDSMSLNSNSQDRRDVEIQYFTNADGFGYDTAFNVNQKVPDFGIRLEDGNHKVIRNALFSRLVKDEANPYNNIVELVYTADSGKQETVRLREREYHEVISCVQKLEESKREFASSDNKWNEYEWQKASLEYLRRMGLDDNTYRLNSAEDFVHNLAIHCRKDQVHNTEEAFKMAAQMLEAMPKYERKYYMKLRKDWDKKNGAGNWDKTHIIDVFNKNHASVQLNSSEMESQIFDKNKAFENGDPSIQILKKGEQIEDTKTHVGDSISFALKYKNQFGETVEEERSSWKILKVAKSLYSQQALLVNEETKAYMKIPYEKLLSHIQKYEKVQKKENKIKLKKDQKEVGFER